MYIEYKEVPSKGYFFGLTLTLINGCLNAGFCLAGNGINEVLNH